MLRRFIVLCCWVLSFVALPLAAKTPHVLVISIDGLRPEIYRDPDGSGVAVPNLTALVERGTYADGVIGVFPSVTYPSHTTIVTGVEPARHGVTSNFRRGTLDWLKNASDIRVPALWDIARQGGVTTSAIMWPMTYGAAIDWLITETDETRKEDLKIALTRGATKGLIEELSRDVGPPPVGQRTDLHAIENLDRMSAAYAAQILKRHKPGLMLVHFLEADHMQHRFGPNSSQARQAFEHIDMHVGTLIEALKTAGTAERTDVIVIGDHGFAPVHTVINVGRLLLDTGLAMPREGDVNSDLVFLESHAGSGIFHAKPNADPALLDEFLGKLQKKIEQDYRGILVWLTDADIVRLGGDPNAVAGITAAPGYMIAVAPDTERSLPTTRFRGMHGYTPEIRLMDTGMIAAGPSFREGQRLPVARLLDVAPTVAAILGLEMKATDGDVMVGALKQVESAENPF